MPLDLATADALDALALQIFDSDTGIGLSGPDTTIDQQLRDLIAPAMLAIDGRTLSPGSPHTLNITMALKLRPKHWYAEIEEYNTRNPGVSSRWPCFVGLLLVPDAPTGFAYNVNSYGATLGLATDGAICRAWAQITRLWLAGNYPLAVAPPPVSA